MILTDEEFEVSKNLQVNCTMCHYYNLKQDRLVFSSCCSKCKLNDNGSHLRVSEILDTKFEPTDEWKKGLKELIKMKK